MISLNKSAIILGGNGLLGSAISKQLLSNYNIIVIDRSNNHDTSKSNFINADIFDFKFIAKSINKIKPDLIINAVNMATITSSSGQLQTDQIITFVNLLKHILSKSKKTTYIQIGTTGSGGLGLDIPFTHGDDIKNLPILKKAAAAGVLTMMLVLLSRTVSNRVLEFKPGLSIFDNNIEVRQYKSINVVTINGGESGKYTSNELALLTEFMGFTTSDKIAKKIIQQISKSNFHATRLNLDVISAINQSIIGEDEEDNTTKERILMRMRALEKGNFLIATGNLGPACVTKALFDGYILYKHSQPNVKIDYKDLINKDSTLRDSFDYLKKNKPEYYKYILNTDSKLMIDYNKKHFQPYMFAKDYLTRNHA